MTESSDPLRLVESDDAPPELRQLLTQAAEHRLSRAQAAQLLGFVEARGSDPVAPGEAASASLPQRAMRSHLPVKLLSALAIVVAAGLGGSLVLNRSSKAHDPEAARPLPHFSASPVPFSVGVVPPTQSQVPTFIAEQTALNSPALPPTRERPRSEVDQDEYTLLRAARDALAREPARALSLADQHARQFSSGMLAQEREAIAVDALVRLRNIGPAKVRAQRFLRNYPQSPYTKRVENAIRP